MSLISKSTNYRERSKKESEKAFANSDPRSYQQRNNALKGNFHSRNFRGNSPNFGKRR